MPIQFLNDFAIKISLDIPFDTSHQQSLESKICWSALREDLHSTTTPWCLSAIITFGHKNFPSFEFLGCISLWRFDQSFLTRVNIRQDRFINSDQKNMVRQQDISWILPSKRHGISWVDLGCDINLYDWITMDSLQKILQVFFRPSGFHLDLDWSPSRIHQNLPPFESIWIQDLKTSHNREQKPKTWTTYQEQQRKPWDVQDWRSSCLKIQCLKCPFQCHGTPPKALLQHSRQLLAPLQPGPSSLTSGYQQTEPKIGSYPKLSALNFEQCFIPRSVTRRHLVQKT